MGGMQSQKIYSSREGGMGWGGETLLPFNDKEKEGSIPDTWRCIQEIARIQIANCLAYVKRNAFIIRHISQQLSVTV